MEPGVPRGAGKRPRLGARSLVLAAAVTFVIGALVGSEGALGTKALGVLAALGAPQYEAYQAMYEAGEKAGSADYLLFFHPEHRAQFDAYLEAHPEVRITAQTIFDSGVVVSIPEPAQPWVDRLHEEPFVRILVRDRPFFLCH